jgi:hypothetical protein
MLAMPIPTSLVALSAWPASQGIGVSQPLFVALFLFKKSEVSVLQTDSSLIDFSSSKLNHLLIENLSVDRLMQLNGKVMAYYYDLCTCLLTTISGAHTPRGRVTAMPASSSNLFGHSFHLPDVVNPSSFGSSSSVSQGMPSGYLTPPISNPAPFGYSPAHASYASERIAWQDASIRGKAPRLTKQLLAILVDIYYEVKDQSTDIMDEDPTVCHQFLITYMLPRLTIVFVAHFRGNYCRLLHFPPGPHAHYVYNHPSRASDSSAWIYLGFQGDDIPGNKWTT